MEFKMRGHTNTHRFSGLWVDHLTLVKVKLAVVILKERDGTRNTVIVVANSNPFVCRAVNDLYLDK